MITDTTSYKKAKAELKDLQWRKDHLQGSDSFTWHTTQHIALINAALLAYRRAHNIFEVGDKIVSTLKGNDFWMQCVCTIDAFHKNMAITNGGGHTIHHYEYRHITDEEREANRRLDQ